MGGGCNDLPSLRIRLRSPSYAGTSRAPLARWTLPREIQLRHWVPLIVLKHLKEKHRSSGREAQGEESVRWWGGWGGWGNRGYRRGLGGVPFLRG